MTPYLYLDIHDIDLVEDIIIHIDLQFQGNQTIDLTFIVSAWWCVHLVLWFVVVSYGQYVSGRGWVKHTGAHPVATGKQM